MTLLLWMKCDVSLERSFSACLGVFDFQVSKPPASPHCSVAGRSHPVIGKHHCSLSRSSASMAANRVGLSSVLIDVYLFSTEMREGRDLLALRKDCLVWRLWNRLKSDKDLDTRLTLGFSPIVCKSAKYVHSTCTLHSMMPLSCAHLDHVVQNSAFCNVVILLQCSNAWNTAVRTVTDLQETKGAVGSIDTAFGLARHMSGTFEALAGELHNLSLTSLRAYPTQKCHATPIWFLPDWQLYEATGAHTR